MSGIALGKDSFPNEDEKNSNGTDAILNYSLFYDYTEPVTLGLESNFLLPFDGPTEILIMPQLNLSINNTLNWQIGYGTRIQSGQSKTEIGTRLIKEF